MFTQIKSGYILIFELITNEYFLQDPNGECPAKEVFKYRDENGHFGQSPEPR